MASDKLLAEWFWCDRWNGSSAFLLPLEARGLYREMLTQAWRRGAVLPNDHETIRRAVGATPKEWKRCWPLIERFWRIEGDTLVNDTQVEVYADARARSEKASAKGAKGAKKRWTQDAQALPEHMPRHVPEQSPSNSLRSLSLSQNSGKNERAIARGPSGGAMEGTLPRNHVAHSYCGDDFTHCVPMAMHEKLTGLLAPRHALDRQASAKALMDWYPVVIAGLPPGHVMGDAFKFWQGQFDQTFATQAPRAASRLTEPIDSMTAGVAEILRKQGVIGS